MAKKTEITAENAYDIFRFFRKNLKSTTTEILINQTDRLHYLEAKKELKTIYSDDQTDRVIDHNQLQNWINNHINKVGWKRCLSNLRQARYKKQNGVNENSIKIDSSVFKRIDFCANQLKMTKKDFIAKIMFEYENNTSNNLK